uniref:Uncharacterized protein n=1 Tax=Lactuca sativa TaxID=4236 RepID=A0A9R1V8W0_LACSA|nr:hypothetical protein LSAT_V11C600317200 [Lactuca sativa]
MHMDKRWKSIDLKLFELVHLELHYHINCQRKKSEEYALKYDIVYCDICVYGHDIYSDICVYGHDIYSDICVYGHDIYSDICVYGHDNGTYICDIKGSIPKQDHTSIGDSKIDAIIICVQGEYIHTSTKPLAFYQRLLRVRMEDGFYT